MIKLRENSFFRENNMKINMLIVDDIEANLYSLEVLFEELEIKNEEYEGLNIFKALSGEEALRVVLKESIDLILLDIRMPNMDGFEVAEILKTSKKTAHIPIIFLTAEFKSEEFITKGFKAGAIDYFIKPIERYQFLNKIQLYINLFLAQKLQKKEFDYTLSEYIRVMDEHIMSSDMDLNGTIIRVSQAFCDMSGYTKEELIGKNYEKLKSLDADEDVYKELWETIENDKEWKGELKNITKSGEDYWVEVIISPIYNKKHNKIGYSSIKHNITNRKRLERISITDGLTNIFNRRYFDQMAPKIVNNIKREDTLICFAILDIDYFKKYNDYYGHQKGDEVLKQVANKLSSLISRAGDYCFRIGGEEFCIIYNANDKQRAYEFMVEIKNSIEKLHIEHIKSDVSKYVTISIGITCEDGKSVENYDKLFKKADKLLYKAKENGRNQVVLNED